MDIYEIENVLIRHLQLDEVYVTNNDKYYQIIAVSDQFYGMSILQRQKMIYAPLMQYILDNRIHALSIKVFTKAEWKRECKLFIQ